MDESSNIHHKCVICEKNFSISSNLYQHMRNIHGVKPVFPNNLATCSLCNIKLKSNNSYEQHLDTIHDIKLIKSELQFNTYEEFKEWKKNLEKTTNAEFVQKCGAKRKQNGKVIYFYCHRSGIFTSKGTGERCLKQHGSNRIDSNCPSKIKVTEKENKVDVEFIETHVGHKCNMGKLHIAEDEKLRICSQLQMNIPISKILDDIRESYNEDFDRRHIITRKDILNIKREFNINDDGRLDSNDAVSIEKWVLSFNKENTPVVFFKQQGVLDPSIPELAQNDFLLAIMNHRQKKC